MATEESKTSFQHRVMDWAIRAFGEADARNLPMRRHRFLEEALEAVQADGGTKEEALELVEYVFGRPIGMLSQEIGGIMVTLSCWCEAHGIFIGGLGERELQRCHDRIDIIRQKHANKPKFGALPGPTPTDSGPVNIIDRPHPVSDAVNHPQHYGGEHNVYEAIKVIDAWGLGFCLGNTVKYISRAGKKLDGDSNVLSRHTVQRSKLQDLKKARWYLDHEIQQLEQQMAAGSRLAETAERAS